MKYTSDQFSNEAQPGSVDVTDCAAAWEEALPSLSDDLKIILNDVQGAHHVFLEALSLSQVQGLPGASLAWLEACAFSVTKTATHGLLAHTEGKVPAVELVSILFRALAWLASRAHQMTYYFSAFSQTLAEQTPQGRNKVPRWELN